MLERAIPVAALRVLLVDDEPRIVSGLQRLLRPHRDRWSVSVATSAQDALALMAEAPFDVVVSDMRMPVMDGAAFLTVAREKYPAMMRVVLSGQTDAEATSRVLPVAHQFLSKPTERATLIETLERVWMLHTEIEDPRVRAAIGGIDALPTLPAVCAQLTALLASEDASVSAIAHLVEGEAAIVAKVLQVVNSPFFGARRRISSVREAVSYLGTEQLKNIVLTVAIVSSLPARAAHFDAAAFQDHSITIARVAGLVAADRALADTSFAAGLLHDVGKLAMASTMPELFDAISRACKATGRSFEDVELELGGCGHARLGATLLHLWGIPFDVVEAVLYYGRAPAMSGTKLESWDAVHLAHRIVGAAGTGIGDDADHAYLSRLGQLPRLPELRAMGATP
jgi:HD-like signal output (HDOD) protein/ActR/RegA family two-component response regulator